MLELTDKHVKMIEETHDTVNTLKTVLLGVNGDEGLVGDVKQLARGHQKLCNRVWILIGVLASTGVLSVSVLELFK